MKGETPAKKVTWKDRLGFGAPRSKETAWAIYLGFSAGMFMFGIMAATSGFGYFGASVVALSLISIIYHDEKPLKAEKARAAEPTSAAP